jgi:hypothetical protein
MSITNTIKQNALIGIAKWVTSPEAWEAVRNAVAALADAKATGEEKRAMAIASLKEAGWRWANWALNLLIEIAVVVVTAKLEEGQQA